MEAPPPDEGVGPPTADTGQYPHRARDAGWVEAARAGDPDAFGKLYDAWFDRCYDVARRIVRDEEVAAEVGQDAFLSAWRNLDGLADPSAFGGWILRIARNQAFNRSQRERRSTPVDDESMAMIAGSGRTPGTGDRGPAGFGVEDRVNHAEDPARIVEDLEAAALVWGAVDALGERDAEVLDLQLRQGLTPAEIGEVLGMNRNAANQLVHRVRGRLDGAVRARVLWRDGSPSCERLGEILAAAGAAGFDAEAMKLITAHAKSCEICTERQRSRLAPAAMFAAVPVAAPILLKQQAASALEAAGVPMAGSAFSSSAAGSGAGTSGEGAGANGTGAPGGPDATVVMLADATPPPSPSAASSRTRVLAMLGAAATIILILVVVLVATGGEDAAEQVAAGPGSTTTTEATTPATEPRAGSTPTTTPPSSLEIDTGETTATTAPPTTSTPTTSPSTTVTSTTSTSTTSSTTTAPPRKVTITVGFRASSRSPLVSTISKPTPWIVGEGPILSWTVAGADGLAIRVHGPDGPDADATLGTTASGTAQPCPGGSPFSTSLCNATVGTHTYTVEVLDGTSLIASSSATLKVTTPPIP